MAVKKAVYVVGDPTSGQAAVWDGSSYTPTTVLTNPLIIDAIGPTVVAGLAFENTTPSLTAGDQYSPAQVFTFSAWTGSTDILVDMGWQARQTVNGDVFVRLIQQVGGAGWTEGVGIGVDTISWPEGQQPKFRQDTLTSAGDAHAFSFTAQSPMNTGLGGNGAGGRFVASSGTGTDHSGGDWTYQLGNKSAGAGGRTGQFQVQDSASATVFQVDHDGTLTTTMTGGNGLVHVIGGVLSRSLLVDVDVDAAAAVAGTKISANFGTQNALSTSFKGTSWIGAGSTIASAGSVRLADGGSVQSWDGAANVHLASYDLLSGGVDIGDAAKALAFHGTAASFGAQIISSTVAVETPALSLPLSDNSNASYALFTRSHAGGAAVAYGDALGLIYFTGTDSALAQSPTAAIVALVDGAVGGGAVPAALVFRTSTTDASGLTEWLRISSAGLLTTSGTFSSSGNLITKTDNANYATQAYYRARVGPAAVQSGDVLGMNLAYGYDGTTYVTAARSYFIVDSAVSGSTVPTSWRVSTGTTAPVDRLSISSAGAWTATSLVSASFSDTLGYTHPILPTWTGASIATTDGTTGVPFLTTATLFDNALNQVEIYVVGTQDSGTTAQYYELAAVVLVRVVGGVAGTPREINSAGAGMPLYDGVGITGITFSASGLAFTTTVKGKAATNMHHVAQAWVTKRPTP